MRKIFALVTAATLAAVLGLTACSTPDDKRGDPGIVRDRDYDPQTKHTTADYDLTIERPDGSTYDLDVTSGGYDHCYRSSKYPKCVDN